MIFHIGDPKTGSTSIQQTLFERTWNSPNHDIAYPDALNALPVARALKKSPEDSAASFRKIRKWLDAQTADAAVISAEHFAPVKPEALKEVIDRFLPAYADRVHIIAYARPHIPRLISSYSQRVKARGIKQDLNRFCTDAANNGKFRLSERFHEWRNVFGTDFTLRPMVRNRLYKGDVVYDFLREILKTEDFAVNSSGHANISPTLDHLACLLEVHKALNKAKISEDLRTVVGRLLATKLTATPAASGDKLKMPRNLLPLLQEAYAEDAAALDSEFFDGPLFTNELKKAEDSATDTPQKIKARARFSRSEVHNLQRIATRLAATIANDPKEWKRQIHQYSGRTYGKNTGKISDKMQFLEVHIEELRRFIAEVAR
ncbi:hypothetical protein ATO1_22275 [Phaeobacter sp. 22II1-1F12B]|nr:hypothetical protein ATO1_22275 [Phaeobacter sp. 22II1-1F12B]